MRTNQEVASLTVEHQHTFEHGNIHQSNKLEKNHTLEEKVIRVLSYGEKF